MFYQVLINRKLSCYSPKGPFLIIIIVALQIILVTLITWHLETRFLWESDVTNTLRYIFSKLPWRPGSQSPTGTAWPMRRKYYECWPIRGQYLCTVGLSEGLKIGLLVYNAACFILHLWFGTFFQHELHLPDLRQPGIRHHGVVLLLVCLNRHEARVAESHRRSLWTSGR